MHIFGILFFVGLLGGVVFLVFLPRKRLTTFTADEMDAFEHAKKVKEELAAVQAMVGPAKAPYTLTLGGANLPPPPQKP